MPVQGAVKEKIIEENLEREMETSFLQYAYSVIYQRALPDAKDGLKPVQRRILFQMNEMRLTPDKPYVKSARVVGDVMGKLHPHGDSAIYDALVRMSQNFVLRMPLVDGHGNFGSLDDGPAAARYTEARLAAPALSMVQDLDENTVDFEPNYDNKLQQPSVLPAAVPNLLVNGSSGIAVGMATNMAPHNLAEVLDAAVYLLQHKNATLDDIMRFIKGPDLPVGGIISDTDGIRLAYETGRGTFKMRAKMSIENVTARKRAIVVTELPYMVGPERALERISEVVKQGKLQGITSAVDLTDRKNGLKLVIGIKSGYDPVKIMRGLYQFTPLEENFSINNVALVDGEPQQLSLQRLLEVWIDHRIEVTTRRTKFRLKKFKDRLHLVNGLLVAILDIDKVIRIIRAAETAKEAATELKREFSLDNTQVDYILDLQLRRLTKFSRVELENERTDLEQKIKFLDEILRSKEKLFALITFEMLEVKKLYATPRRSLIVNDNGSVIASAGNMSQAKTDAQPALLAINDATGTETPPPPPPLFGEAQPIRPKADKSLTNFAIKEMPTTIILSATGKLAKVDIQNVHPFDLTAPKPHDAIKTLINTTTTSEIGVVTNHGNLYKLPVSDVITLDAQENETASLDLSQGVEFAHILDGQNEKPVQIVPLTSDITLALGTKLGIVKRTIIESTKKEVLQLISLKDDDELLGIQPTNDTDDLVFIATDSQMLKFEAKNVRPQGNQAGGMAGIALKDDAKAIYFGVVAQKENALVFTVAGNSRVLPGTAAGSAKITPYKLYPYKGRATGGVRTQKFLKGQDTLIFAGISDVLRANNLAGERVTLPEINERRDGSGTAMSELIAGIG
ncbi:MAG: DNA topoisomerase IV subunit A [Bifidobacteriaceae bacterium]|jgi:DNA gyrase subunit A|nr:DNA topoisomerase IV subunit A [Bifidobacteriaceae bacterium]